MCDVLATIFCTGKALQATTLCISEISCEMAYIFQYFHLATTRFRHLQFTKHRDLYCYNGHTFELTKCCTYALTIDYTSC